MTSIVKVAVKIGGKKYLATSFFLEQPINLHHQFRVNISSNQFSESEAVSLLPNLSELVGKDMQLEVVTVGKKEGLKFVGVVAAVTLSKNYSNSKEVIIKGFSPTIKMDGAVHLTSYSEQKVETIVTQLLEDHNIKYKICLLYTSPSPRDRTRSRMPSSA